MIATTEQPIFRYVELEKFVLSNVDQSLLEKLGGESSLIGELLVAYMNGRLFHTHSNGSLDGVVILQSVKEEEKSVFIYLMLCKSKTSLHDFIMVFFLKFPSYTIRALRNGKLVEFNLKQTHRLCRLLNLVK